MIILTIRTNQPEAELGLFDDKKQLAYTTWPAHKQLAETIHLQIKQLLDSQKRCLTDVKGVVVFKGPGSFTGLRIGISVANALAGGLNVPIIGSNGEQWIVNGIAKLRTGSHDGIVLPEYGSLPHTTKPKH